MKSKRCCVCKESKLVSDFYKHRNTKDGYETTCRACCVERNRKVREADPAAHSQYMADYYTARRETLKTRAAARYVAEKDSILKKQSEKYFLKTHGLTKADVAAMVAAQGGVCAICRQPAKKRGFHVDHEHVDGYGALPPETKRLHIRGVLCNTCNIGLGSFYDSTELLEAAAEYLRQHAKKRASNDTRRTASG